MKGLEIKEMMQEDKIGQCERNSHSSLEIQFVVDSMNLFILLNQ